jgi:ferredoxin
VAGYRVSNQDTDEALDCQEGNTLLEGMLALSKSGIPVGCRGGGCGVCNVAVVYGTYSKRPMSREHVSAADGAVHRVLACRIGPTSDIAVKVLGKINRFARGPAQTGESV